MQGRHLVIVYYGPRDIPGEEWIANQPDPALGQDHLGARHGDGEERGIDQGISGAPRLVRLSQRPLAAIGARLGRDSGTSWVGATALKIIQRRDFEQEFRPGKTVLHEAGLLVDFSLRARGDESDHHRRCAEARVPK